MRHQHVGAVPPLWPAGAVSNTHRLAVWDALRRDGLCPGLVSNSPRLRLAQLQTPSQLAEAVDLHCAGSAANEMQGEETTRGRDGMHVRTGCYHPQRKWSLEMQGVKGGPAPAAAGQSGLLAVGEMGQVVGRVLQGGAREGGDRVGVAAEHTIASLGQCCASCPADPADPADLAYLVTAAHSKQTPLRCRSRRTSPRPLRPPPPPPPQHTHTHNEHGCSSPSHPCRRGRCS